MRHRSHLPAKERAARSRLAQALHDRPILRGSLVLMSRTCGKETCKCARGEKHVSLYLSIRVGQKRKMICVPRRLEDAVRSWVEVHREVDRLIARVSQACLQRFLKEKKRGQKRIERTTR